MKERGPIYHKSKEFALMAIDLCRLLQSNGEYIISKQLFRSATSIGANYREGFGAESENDFIHKISVSIKETHESQYWLELLYDGNYISKEQFDKLYLATDELIRMMTASVLTLKKRQSGAAAT
ncbi:MAG: four helix bundle protein [Bacteroidales bacterium]|nr:four helix bundle protein [Bacteroidales bacterium]